MTPYKLKLAVVGMLALLLITAGGVWKVQDWRYGKELAEQAGLYRSDLNIISKAATAAQRTEQDKRLALEQRLSASEQSHYKELSDAQTNQARLRDRLATSDLRLSVLLDATDSAGGCSAPAGTGGGEVHGRIRARLAPAHAQRIIGITDAGDQGLIALAACQAYAGELQKSRNCANRRAAPRTLNFFYHLFEQPFQLFIARIYEVVVIEVQRHAILGPHTVSVRTKVWGRIYYSRITSPRSCFNYGNSDPVALLIFMQRNRNV